MVDLTKPLAAVTGGSSLPLLSGALPLISSYVGYKGQEKANESNQLIAQQNRDFQERMSSTAYQRSMTDMKKAGLNPMLAFMKGGASTPPGATAQMKNTLENVSSTAMQMTRLMADVENVRANTKLTNNKADLIAPASTIMEAIDVGAQDLANSAKDMYSKAKINIPTFVKKVQGSKLDLSDKRPIKPKIPPKNYYKRKPLRGER